MKRRMTMLGLALVLMCGGGSALGFSLGAPSPEDAEQRHRSQRQRHGGHGLDASLQVGSGGYNRPTHSNRRKLRGGLYGAGSSRSIYRVGRNGDMVYDARAAFGAPGRYGATGRGARHKRFRYSR